MKESPEQKKIDELMAQAKDLIDQATSIADEHGIVLYGVPLDVEPRLQYYPKGLVWGDYPWFYSPKDDPRTNEEKDEAAHEYAGEWVTSSVNCN